MATRRVTIEFNAFSNFADYLGTQEEANSYANLIKQRLVNAGWSVINCTAIALPAFIHVTLNINLNYAYDAASTANRYLPDALAPDWTISLAGGTYTDSAQPQNNSTNPSSNNMATATYVTTVNGFDIYRDAQGCFYYDTYLGAVPVDCSSYNTYTGTPKPNFLEQIGNALGFNKTTGLGKTGLTAAAGGAVALIAVVFLLTRNK